MATRTSASSGEVAALALAVASEPPLAFALAPYRSASAALRFARSSQSIGSRFCVDFASSCDFFPGGAGACARLYASIFDIQ